MTDQPAKVHPRVLLLDDALEQVASLERAFEPTIEITSKLFQDVQDGDIEGAHLIVVDFDLSHWIEKDIATSAALRPADGLAVIEILRSHLRRDERMRPTAFVILSGELQRLTAPYKANRRPHLISALSRVEWVFEKGSPTKETAEQVGILARAVAHLPNRWPHDAKSTKIETLQRQLNLRLDAVWRPTAIDDITKCHPPIQELSTWSHGVAFLRWLLQRILPYSTFLVDDVYLALRLGVTVEALAKNLSEESPLSELIKDCRYAGVLADFAGRRWWRAGVDHAIWHVTKDSPFSRSHLRERIGPLLIEATWLDLANPVPVVNEDYQVIGIDDAERCVQLRPDDWPSYADAAWATRDLVQAEEAMQLALLTSEDRVALGGAEANG